MVLFPTEFESSDDGSKGTQSVLNADWSVVTKYGAVFDVIHINELLWASYYQFELLLAICSAAAQVQNNFSLLT